MQNDSVFPSDSEGSIGAIQDPVANETLNYSYDVLDRLTGVSGAYSQSYSYNTATGNLESKTGLGSYSYTDPAHIHAVTGLDGTPKYAYDANGNMTSRVVGGLTYSMIYDAENRLVEILQGSAKVAGYGYDGDGVRVLTKLGNNDITITLGDTFEVFIDADYTPTPPTNTCTNCTHKVYLPVVIDQTEKPATGQVWRTYYYADGQRVALRLIDRAGGSSGVYWIYSDHLGSTSVTADSSGAFVSELRYKAWGETRTSTGVTPTQRKFTGQLEAEAGLYFYNARWFDPSLGRFAQSDSIISQPGNPLAWDRYGYVGNNPINRIDPSGHADIDSDGVGAPFSILIQLLHDIYDWNLSSEFNEGQVSIIRDSAWKIRDYLSDLRNSDDMYLMKKLFGGIMFRYNTELNQFLKSSVGPSAESVHLYKDFERLGWKPKGSVGMVIHELGHVLDNRMGLETPRIIYCTQYYCEASPAVIDGGGPADSLVDYIGGTQSWPYRFLGFTYIPPMFRFQGDFEYGNNSSADYFAQAFMANVLGNGSPYVTSLWMESYLRLLQ